MNGKRPFRVLQILDTLGMGGAETWLMEVLRLWSKGGFAQMDFLATSGIPGLFDEEAKELGAQIHYLRYGRTHLAKFAKQFRQVLREGDYDAIHDHQDYASGWHLLMGTGTLPAVRVTHVHNPWLHIEAHYAISPLRRLTAAVGKRLVHQLATHVCGTSREILGRYGFHSGQRRRPAVSVVHCGFDVGRFSAPREFARKSVLREFGWPAETKIVLFAGRLDWRLELDHPKNHKNSWLALNVVRSAVARDSSVRLLMAGEGSPIQEELNQRIGDWGLRDQLRLVGVRNDVPRLMRAADVLFFPSRQEGLGMVAVEAQAAALPVLASTAVPREAVVISELYKALPLSEPLERWAGELLRLMTQPRMALDVCRSALEASPFSIENSARRLEAIYRSGQK